MEDRDPPSSIFRPPSTILLHFFTLAILLGAKLPFPARSQTPVWDPLSLPQALADPQSTLKGLVSAALLQDSGFQERFSSIEFLAQSLSTAENSLPKERGRQRGQHKAWRAFLDLKGNFDQQEMMCPTASD